MDNERDKLVALDSEPLGKRRWDHQRTKVT